MHNFFFSLLFCWSVTSLASFQQFLLEDESIVDQKNLKTHLLNLTTPEGVVKFYIHFKEKELTFVKKALGVLKSDTKKITGYFRHAPEKDIHIFLRDDKTLANGSARVFPRNIIVLYTSPPTGAHYLVNRDDWIRGIIIHELTHIVHMDMTEGILEGIETFFGTIGKLGGVVPLWFSEGLATWAETAFSAGGRGRNPLLRYEVHQKILSGNFCHSIDCLDNPGVYPYGSTAYWFGWRFLTFLENKREGTLRCFVKSNARKLPFFLNSVFRQCTGRNIQENFQYFLTSLKEKYVGQKEKHRNLFEKISLPFKGDGVVFQKGIRTKKGLFYYVSDDQKRHFMNVYDPKSEEHYSFRIKENIFSLLSTHEDDLFFSTFRQRPDMNPRYLKSLRKGTITDIDLPRGFDYFFKTRKGRFYFSYENNRWSFYQVGREPPLKIFKELEDIQSPFLRGEKIIFKSVSLQGKSHHSLRELDLNTYEIRNIISFGNSFIIKGKCDDHLFIGNDEGDFVYNFQTFSKLEGVRPLARVVQGESSSLWFFQDDPLHAYKSRVDCKKTVSSFTVKNITLPFINNVSSNEESVDRKNYSGLKYLTPTYWFLFFNSNEKETEYDAHTRLSDPLNIHSLSLRANYFTTSRKFGGEIFYQRDWEKFLSLVGHKTSHSTRDFSKVERSYMEILKVFYWRGWTFSFGLGPNREIVKSKLSKEITNTNYNVKGGLSYQTFLHDSFIQTFLLQTKMFKNENSWGSSFFGGTWSSSLNLRPLLYWYLNLEGNYSRYAKEGFVNVIRAGGVSDSVHGMYSIPKDDALGNSVVTARETLKWDALHVYRGLNFFPLKLNKIGLYSGMEHLKADRISLNNRLLRDETVSATFIGVNFQTIFFYQVPVDIDVVYSRLEDKYKDNRVVFVLQSALSL